MTEPHDNEIEVDENPEDAALYETPGEGVESTTGVKSPVSNVNPAAATAAASAADTSGPASHADAGSSSHTAPLTPADSTDEEGPDSSAAAAPDPSAATAAATPAATAPAPEPSAAAAAATPAAAAPAPTNAAAAAAAAADADAGDSSVRAAAADAAAADAARPAAPDSETTAAYNASIEKLKDFIKSLDTETRMKTAIQGFELNKSILVEDDVKKFADQVIDVLNTLAGEKFDNDESKFPYANDCIAQINDIKTALIPVIAGGGMKKSRQSRRSRSRNRNRSKSAHGRSKRR